MSVTTFTSTSTSALPRVNLLPPEIAEERRMRRVKVALVAGVAGCAAVVGLLTMSASNSVSSAQEELDAATAARAKVQAQVASLASVKQVYATVAERETLFVQAMGDEVRWSGYLNDLALTIPSDVWMSTVEFTQSTGAPAATAATGARPVVDPGIGTVTFTGFTRSHDDVATLLEALAKQKGYANPYFSSSSVTEVYDQEVFTFTSTVTLTPAAKSGRFTKPAGS